MPSCPGPTFSSLLFAFQVILLILFATLADYGPYSDPVVDPNIKHGDSNSVPYFYPMFQDVHVMIFIGFGFLMTFLKRYGYGAIGYNLFIAALMLQWATLIGGWMENAFSGIKSGKVAIDIKTLITSDFAAAAVLITFGAVLGKVTRLQLFLIGVFELIFYSLNEKILSHKLKISDVGGSMVIHAFGAYFGLAVARVIYTDDVAEENEKEGSNYHSDLFSMVGTVFLWMFWPSFNGGLLGPGTQQNRAIINTYYSLAACVCTTFVVSALVNKNFKLNMVHIQNATLAGGVAVGSSADLVLKPWGAILIGMIAGVLSTVGYAYVQPFLYRTIKLHDTCGVNNLHGMPGLMGGLGGAIAAAMATYKAYGEDMYSIWPAVGPVAGAPKNSTMGHRTVGEQAGIQTAAIFVTLGISIVGGIITGFIVKFIDPPSKDDLFDDENYWDVPLGIQLKCVKMRDTDVGLEFKNRSNRRSIFKNDVQSEEQRPANHDHAGHDQGLLTAEENV